MTTFSPFRRIAEVRVALSQSIQKHVFGYFLGYFWRVFRYSEGTFWPLFPILSLRLKIGKIGQNLIPPGLRSTHRVTIFQEFGHFGQIPGKWWKIRHKWRRFSHKFRSKIAFFERILERICVFSVFPETEKTVFLQVLSTYMVVTDKLTKFTGFWRLFIVPRTEILRGSDGKSRDFYGPFPSPRKRVKMGIFRVKIKGFSLSGFVPNLGKQVHPF